MATGQSSGQITVLDTRTGLVISTWCAHEGEVLQLVAVNENTVISSSLDQTVSVWNVHDGKFKFNIRLVLLSFMLFFCCGTFLCCYVNTYT